MTLVRRLIPSLAALLAFGLPLVAESLWKDSNLFSSSRKLEVGDIVKIQFAHKSLVRYRSEMKTSDSQKAALGKPNVPAFSFLPAFDNAVSADRSQRVEYTTEKEFQTRIAVRIVAVLSNDILQVQGTHTVAVNGQQEQVSVGGLVRRDDLQEGNAVNAWDIANLNFNYLGPSVERRQTMRSNDLVWQSATNTNRAAGAQDEYTVREALKRRLILDQLNRIADILFRQ